MKREYAHASADLCIDGTIVVSAFDKTGEQIQYGRLSQSKFLSLYGAEFLAVVKEANGKVVHHLINEGKPNVFQLDDDN